MPYPADQMMEVSPFVNSVKNNRPECLIGVEGGGFKGFYSKATKLSYFLKPFEILL